MKEMNARKENTEPNSCMPDDQHVHYTIIEMESSNTSQSRNKSKEKVSTRDISLLAGTLGLPQVFMLWSFFLEKGIFILASARGLHTTNTFRFSCYGLWSVKYLI